VGLGSEPGGDACWECGGRWDGEAHESDRGGERRARAACGAGSLQACRQALQQSLSEALSVTPQQIYGQGECAENAQASCFDMNRFTSASAVSVPAFPFQNRPTFQQVVELTKTLPR
jgi:hypothetical protein